jgi:DNA (cytosine-5)-methyltransferase 1
LFRVVYNEIDRFCCDWLSNLMDAGLIVPGLILDCDVRDLDPRSLRKAVRVHLFAGIGGWDYALALAGWPRDRPVWTCSCPCQPFSGAGQGAGFDDPRHLWPQVSRLLRVRRPAVLFGEQVASPLGRAWLDLVLSDLEDRGYAVGAVVAPAAGVGAPHIRHRLFFLAQSKCSGFQGAERTQLQSVSSGQSEPARGSSSSGGLADADGAGSGVIGRTGLSSDGDASHGHDVARRGALGSFWSDVDWLHCRDGKWRSVEPGSFPLAHGSPARVGRLRAYGNAIVPQIAAEFVKAYLDTRGLV